VWSRSGGARWLFWAAAGLVALHLALLLAALPDYRVSIDAGYHVALARQYAENFVYFWDTLHYQPAGRPNLRGPAVHIVMALLGRALGGTGDDYVMANALLGIACWLTATVTVFFFAKRYGGPRAALVAVALFTGSAWASASFYVNLPSGWVFVLTPWAIHWFLRQRLWGATLLTTVACYAHLAGFATVPVGLIVAALLARRLRDLIVVGAGVTVLTSPYWIHFLRSLPWYVGKVGGEMWLVDGLLGIFWIVGLLYLARSPRQHAFLISWTLAPVAWLLQNPNRFILQSSLAGATIGAVALEALFARARSPRLQGIATAVLVIVATLFPLGPPSLGAELTWLLTRYPRRLDWDEMRHNARVIREQGLADRLTNGLGATAVAVWSNLHIEGGPWKRVRPPKDEAERVSVADRNYILPIPPDDPELRTWQGKGWVRIHGGGNWRSIVTFPRPVALSKALAHRDEIWAREARWIAAHCEHNTLGDWFTLFWDSDEIPRRRAIRGECRTRVARLQVATLLWAYALEDTSPEQARRIRSCANGWRALSALLGDEHALDYRNEAWHAHLREAMRVLGESTSAGENDHRVFANLITHVYSGRQGRFNQADQSEAAACLGP